MPITLHQRSSPRTEMDTNWGLGEQAGWGGKKFAPSGPSRCRVLVEIIQEPIQIDKGKQGISTSYPRLGTETWHNWHEALA